MGYGGLNLPYDVPANQYVTFRARRPRRARVSGESVLTYLDRYQPDAIRYCLAATPAGELRHGSDRGGAHPPHTNDELVATWATWSIACWR